MEFGHTQWRKSSYTADGTECVELAYCTGISTVGIRDSKDPDGGVLLASLPAWEAFRRSVRL